MIKKLMEMKNHKYFGGMMQIGFGIMLCYPFAVGFITDMSMYTQVGLTLIVILAMLLFAQGAIGYSRTIYG